MGAVLVILGVIAFGLIAGVLFKRWDNEEERKYNDYILEVKAMKEATRALNYLDSKPIKHAVNSPYFESAEEYTSKDGTMRIIEYELTDKGKRALTIDSVSKLKCGK